MKNYPLYIGIDVSKMKLDVVFLFKDQRTSHTHLVVENSKKGIKSILNSPPCRGIQTENILFSFEDTGIYSLPLCYELSAMRLDYWMVPAIEIKRSKGIARGKTDKADARDIAFYAMTHLHKLRLGSISDSVLIKLKLLFAEREKLLKAIRMLETTQENVGFLPKESLQDVLKINRQAVAALQKNLMKIEAEMSRIIDNDEMLSQQSRLVTSIPGIGPQTAVYLLLVTKGFSCFDNWRQLACYAGVAPFEYSSGSSVRGRTKVSPLADKKLKSLLNMCAMNAKKADPQLKAYYERKVAEGKSKMLVLNNIRCKLLARVFAVINRQQPFVNLNKFVA